MKAVVTNKIPQNLKKKYLLLSGLVEVFTSSVTFLGIFNIKFIIVF